MTIASVIMTASHKGKLDEGVDFIKILAKSNIDSAGMRFKRNALGLKNAFNKLSFIKPPMNDYIESR